VSRDNQFDRFSARCQYEYHNRIHRLRRIFVHHRWLQLICGAALFATSAGAVRSEELTSLQGTWVMDSAYEVQAYGTRTTNFGEHPAGLLTIDAQGRYGPASLCERRQNAWHGRGIPCSGAGEQYPFWQSNDRSGASPTHLRRPSGLFPQLAKASARCGISPSRMAL
jgi:hypothetical protein